MSQHPQWGENSELSIDKHKTFSFRLKQFKMGALHRLHLFSSFLKMSSQDPINYAYYGGCGLLASLLLRLSTENRSQYSMCALNQVALGIDACSARTRLLILKYFASRDWRRQLQLNPHQEPMTNQITLRKAAGTRRP